MALFDDFGVVEYATTRISINLEAIYLFPLPRLLRLLNFA